MSEQKLKEYQLKKLKKISGLAYKNIPFYTNKWNQAGFHPSMIKTMDDISKIPILTKDELRSSFMKGLDTSKWKDGRWLATTGSTGAYINLFQPLSKITKELAVMSPFFASAFFQRKIHKGLMFLVIEEDSYEAMGGFELPNPKIRFDDVFTPLEEMIRIIREFKPDVIVTYPSRLKELLSYMEENNISDVTVSTILTSGEKLDEVVRYKTPKYFHGSILKLTQ
jgi:phenylacetate-CoA ligase